MTYKTIEEQLEEIQRTTTTYFKLSEIFPMEYQNDLVGISEDAPFSWGDNEATLVMASRLLEHCKEAWQYEDNIPWVLNNFMELLDEMNDSLIDLEN